VIARVKRPDGSEFAVEAEPVCMVDFCALCGECLDCYGGEPCWDGEHRWGDHMWHVQPGDRRHEELMLLAPDP